MDVYADVLAEQHQEGPLNVLTQALLDVSKEHPEPWLACARLCQLREELRCVSDSKTRGSTSARARAREQWHPISACATHAIPSLIKLHATACPLRLYPSIP